MSHCANVKDFGSGSGASYIIIQIAISLAVVKYERSRRLKICASSLPPFCSVHSSVGS